MNKILHSLFATLAVGLVSFCFADVPTAAYLSADRASTVSVSSGGSATFYDLSSSTSAPDGNTWYGGSDRTTIGVNTQISASLIGYLTAWYTYGAAPSSLRERGPSFMTRQLGDSKELVLTTSIISNLFGSFGASSTTDLYAKFTPITYSLAYEMNEGTFSAGASHPATATYDKSFTVSAPKRDAYTFAGWKVGKDLYFEGETADVEMVNLTTNNNEEVSIVATWSAKSYPLTLVVGTGVAKITCVADSTTSAVTSTSTVQIPYGSTWKAWAEPAYGYTGSGAGWSEANPQSGVKGDNEETFEPIPSPRAFSVVATVSPENAGTVSLNGTGSGGKFDYKTSVTLTATPASGYAFASWSDGTTANPKTLVVEGETSLTATFAPAAYKLTFVLPTEAKTGWYRLGGHGAYTSIDETTEVDAFYGTTYEYYVEAKAGYQVTGSGSSANRPKTGTMGAGAASVTVTIEKGVDLRELMLVVGTGVAKIHWWTDLEDAWFETTSSTTLTYAAGTRYRAYADASAGYSITGAGSSAGSAVSGTISESGAVFEPKATVNTYLVTVTANPNEGGTVKVNADGRFSAGDRAKVEANAQTGWIFVRWDDVTTAARTNVSSNAVYDFTVTGNVFLDAVFTRETYSVTFVYRNADGKEVSTVQQVAFKQSAEAPPAEMFNNWAGHAFTSWDSSAWQSVSGDCTIRANYSANTYSVRFAANGGIGSMSDQTFTYDAEQALRACTFTRIGYTFGGWTDTAGRTYKDQEIVNNLAFSGALTLTAVWTPKTYTIVFEPGGAGGDPRSEMVAYDTDYALPACPFEYTTEFLGWKTKSVSGLSYTNGETVARLSSDGGTVTLVAQWAQTCQVKFHANYTDDKGLPPAYANEIQLFVSGVENALRANSFTRTGYTFIGWSKKPASARDDVLDVNYVDQSLVSDPADPGETLDLYAVWKPNTYQVVFDGNNHDDFEMPENERVQKYEWDKTEIADPNVKKDVGFLGFDFDPEITTPRFKASEEKNKIVVVLKNLTAIPNDHIRLYAIWDKQNVPTVKSVQKKTFAAPLLSASPTPVLTMDSQPEWENDGWVDLGDGVYTNGDAVATLSRTINTNGTLTFEWMPSAVGDMKDDPFDDDPVDQSTRRSGAKLSIICAGNLLGELKGSEIVCDLEWKSAEFKLDNVTADSVLQITSNAAGTYESKLYPVMLRNVKWTPAVAPSFEKEVSVVFVIDSAKGKTTDETNQTVTVVTNAAGVVTQPGYVKEEPYVTSQDGWTFTGWYDNVGKTNVAIGVVKKCAITDDTTFTAQFKQNDPGEESYACQVSFAIDGTKGERSGGGATEQTVYAMRRKDTGVVTHAAVANEPIVACNAGYDFVAWYDAAGATNIAVGAIASRPITNDMAFTALFTCHDYQITYLELNGAENDPANPMTYAVTNETINFVAPGERSGYVFKGWNPTKIEKGTTGNQTVTATWEGLDPGGSVGPKEVSVSFIVNSECGCRIGGGGRWDETKKAHVDTVIVRTNGYGEVQAPFGVTLSPTVVGTNGWDFAGWYDADGNTNILADALVNYPVKGDVIFTAAFEPHVYDIRYANTRGHNNPNAATFVSTNGVVWGATEPVAYQRLTPFGTETDFSFKDWSPSNLVAGVYGWREASGVFRYTNVVTQAQWRDMIPATNEFRKVTFCAKAADGALVDTNDVVRMVENGKNVTDVPVFAAKAGYRFTGWDRSLDNVTADQTATAQYELIRDPITYWNLKGTTHDNPSEYTVVDEIALKDPSGNENLKFLGWTPTNAIALGTTGAQAFTAAWAYRVTYARTADGHVRSIAGQSGSALKTSCFVADTVGTTNVPAVVCDEGYTFAGWSGGVGVSPLDDEGFLLDAPGGSRVLEDGLLANVQSSVTLTAVATANVYAVSFDGGAGATGEMADQLFIYDVAQVLARNVFVSNGCAFAGWTDKKANVYDDGAIVKNLATGGVVALTAIWRELPPTPTAYDVVIDGTSKSYPVGTEVVVNAPFDEMTVPGTNIVCTGWVGSGDVPVFGLSTQVTFTVTQASTLDWVYETNCWVSVSTGEGSGTVTLEDAWGTVIASEGWHAVGERLVAVATPAKGWGFVQWRGRTGGSPLAFYATGVTEIEAVFEASETYTVSITAGAGGSVKLCDVAGTTVDNPGQFVAGTTLTATATANAGWEFAGWSDGVTTADRTLTVSGNMTLRATVEETPGPGPGPGPEPPSPVESNAVSVVAGEGGSAELQDASGETLGAAGTFAAGTKLKAVAEADEGWVFVEWIDEETGEACGTNAVLDLTVTKDRELRAMFEEAVEPTLTVGPWVFTEEVTEIAASIPQGVYVLWAVEAAEGTVSVSGLPSGLKYTAKAKKDTTSGLLIPAGSIYGSPSSARTSTTKFTVTTQEGRKKVATVYRLTFTVMAMPTELVGKYVGGSTNEPIGSAEITLAKTGKASGKWKDADGKTWTLKTAGFDGYDEETGAYFATVTAKSGRTTETFEMRFGVADVEAGSFHDEGPVAVAECELFDVAYANWKAAPWKALAAELKGETFVVASDDGTTLNGKVAASGAVTVKGTFETGTAKPYSASAKGTLVPVGEDAFELFLYYPVKKNKFDGYAVKLLLTWDGEELKHSDP